MQAAPPIDLTAKTPRFSVCNSKNPAYALPEAANKTTKNNTKQKHL